MRGAASSAGCCCLVLRSLGGALGGALGRSGNSRSLLYRDPIRIPSTSWAGQDASELFPSLPSIESLCSKVLLKARTELFKVVLVHLATRLSSSPTNDR